MVTERPTDVPLPIDDKEQPAKGIFERIIEELYTPLEKKAEDFAKLIGADGKFADSDKARDLLRDAFSCGSNTFRRFEMMVNDKLKDSAHRVVFDTSMAQIQDIGYVYCSVQNRDGKQTDAVGFSVNNSPRVDTPPFSRPEKQPEKQPEIPSDWPRLDIIDPTPKKR